ncbi:IS3 family transposase [Saezia sanguinis]
MRERAVRLVQEQRGNYPSLWATVQSIAPKIGCSGATLHDWVKRSEIDNGQREGFTSSERERLKQLERENKELRRANDILKAASAFFGPGGARLPIEEMKRLIDQKRHVFGVEPMCKVLNIAPSCYFRHAARSHNPALRSPRAKHDDILMTEIERVWQANLQVYGTRKMWHQLQREGIVAARCSVERLMRRLGLQGARRGKKVRTTIADKLAPCPLDHVNRQFHAKRPNELWVSDFTYVSTWQGWLYVAFVIDVFARRIVGWKLSTNMHTDFVLDALEQALYDRVPPQNALIHHSDRGSQYVSIRYTQRLKQAGIEPSVGSRGDSYDNALAETINGLYKTELIHKRGPWKNRQSLEMATLQWVHWYNNHRLLGSIGYIPPVQAEAQYWENLLSDNSKTELITLTN